MGNNYISIYEKYNSLELRYKDLIKREDEKIIKSEELRVMINQEQEDIFKICDLALCCISELIGDNGLFYQENRKKIIKVIENWNYIK